MNHSSVREIRPVPVSLLAVVALVAAVLVGTSGGHEAAHAEGHGHAAETAGHSHQAAASGMTAKQARLQDKMRKLWEDHIVWTRMAIVTFAESPDNTDAFNASAARLLANQTDIGDAIKPYFGKRAGNQLTALLRDHITIAVEVLQAARSGDSAAFDDANARWYANGRDVADAISSLNRQVWPRAAVRDMMRMHLDQTLAEASAELNGDYEASVRSYDEIHQHILAMADALSGGIVATFPGRFR
jgi:hypothetical protein